MAGRVDLIFFFKQCDFKARKLVKVQFRSGSQAKADEEEDEPASEDEEDAGPQKYESWYVTVQSLYIMIMHLGIRGVHF